jgi:hypothetical protein
MQVSRVTSSAMNQLDSTRVEADHCRCQTSRLVRTSLSDTSTPKEDTCTHTLLPIPVVLSVSPRAALDADIYPHFLPADAEQTS